MIYLDYNAGTPVDRRVADAMTPYLYEIHGNPSSGHAIGRRVREAVELARGQVARLIGAAPGEVIFTSGGSESNNTVLKGVLANRRERGNHIVISAVEHPSIMAPCRFLADYGARITTVPVDHTGRVNPDDVRQALTPETILVSIMLANNEVGTIEPVAEIARLARRAGALMHTDAAQAVGKITTRVDDLNVDFLSMAGHKFYAPLGVGALYVRRGVRFEPLIHGAKQEGGRRAGTEAVALIVGLGEAARLAERSVGPPAYAPDAGERDRAPDEEVPPAERQRETRDRLWNGLQRTLGDRVTRHGDPQRCLPNTLNVSFSGQIGAVLLSRLDEVAASPGAACHSGQHEPSAVLSAMGIERELALGAVRFSTGRYTTTQEIDEAVRYIVAAASSPPSSRDRVTAR